MFPTTGDNMGANRKVEEEQEAGNGGGMIKGNLA